MSILSNRRVRIDPDVVMRVVRILGGKGTITVRVGQEIVPTDIIGTSIQSGGFRTLDLAVMLGVSASEVKKYLQRPMGSKIFKGELLALRGGGFFRGKKTVTSPSDGILYSLDDTTGQLRLQFIPKKDSIPAAVFGVVEKVDTLRQQIIIKTQVTRIFGVVGSGRQREGMIDFIGARGDLITNERVIDKYTGHIVIGGGLIYKEAISAAITCGISGIITGGINAKDYMGMSGDSIVRKNKFGTDIGISLLVTEGFGSLPIGNDIYTLFRQYNGRFAILDGNRGVMNLPSFDSQCMIRIKSSQLPPLQGESLIDSVPNVEAFDLKVGHMVRIVAPPFMSEQGKVISIDSEPTKLASGITTIAVGVETRSRKIIVPYLNLEIIS